MSKISTYSLADEPLQLSDRLIGTEAPRPIPSSTPLATKNFSLGELLQLFSSNFPAATLQAVLNAGNIATQNMNLTGRIDVTLIKPVNIEDMLGSEGMPLQILSKGVGGICWIDQTGGGGGTWGSITGDILNQTDLIDYLSDEYYPLLTNPAGYLTQESVLEYPTFTSFPLVGAANTIYIAVDTDIAYYWDGISYVVVTNPATGITGLGTVNTLPKFTPTGSQLGNSRFTDNGVQGRYGTSSNYVEFLTSNIFLRLFRSQATFDIILGNPQISQEFILDSTNNFGNVLRGRGYWAFKVGALGTTEPLRLLSTGQIQLPVTPATGLTSDFILLRDSLGNLKQIAYPTIPTSTVTSVTATSPITSSGGSTPVISTSMATNKLIGRSSAGAGVMEEITLGTGLSLSAGVLSASASGGGILHGVASGTDTYTATITGPTSYVDGDAYLIRFTNGNTTVATLNINGLGAVPLYRNNDGPLLGGDIADGGEMLCIYNTALNEFQVIGVSPNSLLAYITNDDSVTITKGMPVYAFSGTGDRMTVKRAFNISDATSAQTVGLVLSTSIAAGQKGFIIMQGLLDGLSILPTATWADGDPVYLGATAGTITNVKPYAPNHLVYLGVVTTASNGSAGRLYVRVQNGYELDELHNVQAQTPTVNDILYYFGGSPGQWKTASIPTVLGYTPQSVLSGTGIVKSTAGVISYINGSSTQFVKADGSLDSSTYLTSASLTGYVPYTGATADVDLGIRKLVSVDIIAFDGTLGANLTTSGDQEGLYSRSSGKELAIYDGNLREYWFAEGVITYNNSTRLTTISSDLIQTSGVNNGIDDYVGLSSAGYGFEFTGISGSGEDDFGKAFLQSNSKFGFTSRINIPSNEQFTIISNDANEIKFRAERTPASNYTECFQDRSSYTIFNNDYFRYGFFYIDFANRTATLGDVGGAIKNTKIVVDDANENIEFISRSVKITGAVAFQWDGDDIARIIDINDGFVTSKLITGYVSGAGTVTASDTILEAIEKLDGNIAAISAGSGITRSIQSIAVNTAAGSTAATDYVYLVSGPTTLTLPTAVGNTNKYEIKRTGVNTVSIATTGGQTIDSSASPITINVQYASISVISDGANWFII